jgi:hypothetical protein
MILAKTCERDVTNEIKIPTWTEWTPEHDFSQEAREQRILDHQAELKRTIRVEIGPVDEEKGADLWFEVLFPPAGSTEEYEERMPAHLAELR